MRHVRANYAGVCFAMTKNKAQGQTIPNVSISLPKPVFLYDQFYVALSTGISRGNTNVLVKHHDNSKADDVHTSNVVYNEVLSDLYNYYCFIKINSNLVYSYIIVMISL